PVEDRIHLTVEAAKPFGAALILIKAEFHFGDADPSIGREHRHFLPWCCEKAARHRPVGHDAKAAAHRFLRLAAEIHMNGSRSPVAVRNGLDQDARAESNVAPCKDTGGSRHKVCVNLKDSARCHLDTFVAAKEGQVSLLTNGQD